MTDALEIQFEKPSMKYKAGQWAFINVPSVSPHQWHPFTITSCPIDPYISVHVRQVGDFTRGLASALGVADDEKNKHIYQGLDPDMVYEIAPGGDQEMPELRVDGPYGAPAEDVFSNEIAILIGTGIGVTPWAAILKNIWHLRNNPNANRRLKRVEFIWVAKDTSSFEWFQKLLASLERQSEEEAIFQNGSTANQFLNIHTYLTQRTDLDMLNNIAINSVGQDTDPLTQLRARTNFGRPNFSKIFTTLRDGILDQSFANGLGRQLRTDVGVYFCGPNVAAREVKKACNLATAQQVHFKFWKEHF